MIGSILLPSLNMQHKTILRFAEHVHAHPHGNHRADAADRKHVEVQRNAPHPVSYTHLDVYKRQEYDIVARYQGGNNAGHTVKNERGKFVLNLLPSGILRPNVVCVMGNGMVIDPHHLDGEINKLREQGIDISPANLKISDRATITMPYHVEQDGLEEARLAKTGAQFGSTKRGIAYAYGDKYMKKTLRMGDLLHLDDAVKKRLVTMVAVSYTHLDVYKRQVLGAAPLLKKVYIPKYIFPLEKCCFAMVNCVFSFVALLLVMIFTGAS